MWLFSMTLARALPFQSSSLSTMIWGSQLSLFPLLTKPEADVEDDCCVCLSLVIPPKQSRLLLGNGLSLCSMPITQGSSHTAAAVAWGNHLGLPAIFRVSSWTHGRTHSSSKRTRVHSTEKTMDAGILPMDTLSPDSTASDACLTSRATNTIATGHTATREQMAMLGFLKTLRDSPQRLGLLCMPYYPE